MSAPGPRQRLRFSFETSQVRAAAELSADLRAISRCAVRVRPAPRALRTAQGWSVSVDTPPARLGEAAMGHWEEQMDEVLRRHPGCRLVGRMFIPIG